MVENEREVGDVEGKEGKRLSILTEFYVCVAVHLYPCTCVVCWLGISVLFSF